MMRKNVMKRMKPKGRTFLTCMKGFAVRMLASLLVCTAFVTSGMTQGARVSNQQVAVKIARSPLMEMLRRRLEQQPGTKDTELASYANSLISQHGVDYDFDVCEFLKSNPQGNMNESQPQYKFPMTQADGGKITFEISGDAVSDGMCGECFFSFPTLGVTRTEITLLTEGRQYRLKRPRLFGLDEVSMVDSSMRRVLRTWEVPHQSMPLGISADGTRIYIATEFDQLALEVGPSGAGFKATSQIEMQNGKDVEKYPRDPKNDYLGFMRFSGGRKSYIVRYSAPCT